MPENLTPEERRRRLIRKLSVVAQIIRKRKVMTVIELSLETGYSLRTLKYDILPLLTEVFADIEVKGDKVVAIAEGGKSEEGE